MPEDEPELGTPEFREAHNARWKGSEWDRHCRDIKKDIVPETRASSLAARRGLLRVLDCAWPKNELDQKDGLCLAEFSK